MTRTTLATFGKVAVQIDLHHLIPALAGSSML